VRALAQPAGHGRGVAVAHRAAQHGQREPVDLEEDDPGDVGLGDDALAPGDALRDAQRVRVIRADEDREPHAHGGDHQRGKQRPAETVHPQDPIGQGVSQDEDCRVGEQDEHEAEDERQRQPQRREDRRDDRVERRGDRRNEQRAPEAVDVNTRQEPGGHHQGDTRGEPRDEEPEHREAGTFGLPR
jgi:hypothetical protein